jgi:hypothetical protein
MADRIERNVIIARSGVYPYQRGELEALKLSPPTEIKDVYFVYRPAIVLANNKDKFIKLPLTKEHPMVKDGDQYKVVMVTPENYKDFSIGWSGDTASVVMMSDSQKIGIQSTCQLLDESALSYYDNGVRDVSPGYFASFEWAKGTTVDGEDYDIIMTDIDEVNHLAFTQRGRGGQGVAMDSDLSLANLSYYSNRLVTDSDIASFRDMIADIVEYRGEYEDDEIKIGVMELLKLCDNMTECEEKAILKIIIKDFYNVKNAFSGDEAAKVAADLVAGRYESLDSKIMEDSMKLFGKAKDAEPIPAEKEKEAPPAAPAAPEAPPAAPAEPAPPAAPVAAAAMEVAEMPDDVSSLDDPNLLRCLNGVVKALKALMPGEVAEPEHQEAPAAAPAAPPATDSGEEVEKEVKDNDGKSDRQEELENKKGSPMDSMYRMPMSRPVQQTKGIDAFMANLKKGRK